jgi:glycosyltransferase involved in cell wall biosynthesis
MHTLSIIIPTYNAERYLTETIDCIIHQTFQDWELIIVDDCSTDNTPIILHKYISNNSKINFIKTASNSGSARIPRLVGIKIAHCDYVTCIDADDILDTDYFEKMMAKIQNTHADIVCSKLVRFSAGGILYESIPLPSFNLGQVISGIDACCLTLGGWKISASGMVSKRSLMQKILENNNDNYVNSDEIDTRKILFYSHNVAFADTHYYYRIHPESITHKVSPRLFEKLTTNNQLYTFVLENLQQTHPEVVAEFEKECIDTLVGLETLFLQINRTFTLQQKKDIQCCIKKAYKETHANIVPSSTKLSLAMKSYPTFLLYAWTRFKLKKILKYNRK